MPAPNYNLRGIEDLSTEVVPYSNGLAAQHTPLVMLMTKRGPVEPWLIDVDGFDIFYSLQSLGENSPWYTHQSELINIARSIGSTTIMVKRIIDAFSKTATSVIGYQPSTSLVVDMSYDAYSSNLRMADFKPLFTIECADPGQWGNYVGIEITIAPEKVQNVMGAYLGCVIYQATVIVEDENTGVRTPLRNIYGESSTLFTLKRESFYNERDYFFDSVMTDSFIEDYSQLTRQQYFAKFTAHVESMAALAVKEEYWKEDILTKLNPNSGKGFKKGMTFFCQGGDDGFKDDDSSLIKNRLNRQRKYDEAVRAWLDTFDDGSPYSDINKYPFTTIWDTGFTKETKEKFVKPYRLRKDVWVALTSVTNFRYYEIGKEIYFDYVHGSSSQDQISMGAYLRSVFSLYPESVEYGTPTLRATLVLQDGIYRNSTSRKRQTLNYELFRMVTAYCGRSNGKWNAKYAFDQDGLNTINNWKDVSMSYMSPETKEIAWDTGFIYAQYKDTDKMFFPMFQTIYPDDTSVLNNIFLMMACCWLQKIHYKAWTRVTGDSKHTNEQIALRLDDYIRSETKDIFDGRFIIAPKTIYTKSDRINGFSFTTETEIYSNMSKHRANYKLVAHRMS